MRLVADSGLWSTEHPAAPVLMTAVLEVSGAVLSWRVDEPSQLQIAFTDLRRPTGCGGWSAKRATWNWPRRSVLIPPRRYSRPGPSRIRTECCSTPA